MFLVKLIKSSIIITAFVGMCSSAVFASSAVTIHNETSQSIYFNCNSLGGGHIPSKSDSSVKMDKPNSITCTISGNEKLKPLSFDIVVNEAGKARVGSELERQRKSVRIVPNGEYADNVHVHLSND